MTISVPPEMLKAADSAVKGAVPKPDVFVVHAIVQAVLQYQAESSIPDKIAQNVCHMWKSRPGEYEDSVELAYIVAKEFRRAYLKEPGPMKTYPEHEPQ